MKEQAQLRWDLFLLLSLLLVIVMYPVLDHGDFRQTILALLFFVPFIAATFRVREIKAWVSPSVLLMSASIILGVVSSIFPSPTLLGMKWGSVTLFFGVIVIHLFAYLRNARSITNVHLFTAVTIYLMLGMLWFALYSAIDAVFPDSFQYSTGLVTDPPGRLLYFSLVTLATIGYGDVVPLHGEVRILAALEGITGVLYIAITVAILVSAYKRQTS